MDWNKLTREDLDLITVIAKRAFETKSGFEDFQSLTMDLDAAHITSPLDLKRMADGRLFD